MAAAGSRPAETAPTKNALSLPTGRWKKAAEPAGKPGSVVDSHSSRRHVTVPLKQPTRIQRGPRQRIPIWSCSRWGLPYRSVARLAVRSYRTISPLPRTRRPFGGIFLLHFPSACAAQALPGTLPCGARTFLGTPEGMTRLSSQLRQRPLSHVCHRDNRPAAKSPYPARHARCRRSMPLEPNSHTVCP